MQQVQALVVKLVKQSPLKPTMQMSIYHPKPLWILTLQTGSLGGALQKLPSLVKREVHPRQEVAPLPRERKSMVLHQLLMMTLLLYQK